MLTKGQRLGLTRKFCLPSALRTTLRFKKKFLRSFCEEMQGAGRGSKGGEGDASERGGTLLIFVIERRTLNSFVLVSYVTENRLRRQSVACRVIAGDRVISRKIA